MSEPTSWIFLSPEQIEELEHVVKATGWSWNTVYDKTGSTMGEMTAVRNGRRPFAWQIWMPYLEAVAEAVASVPVPERPVYVQEGVVSAPMPPSIPISTIAGTLGAQFLEAENLAPGEREHAQDALGRLAAALGIEEMVVQVIRTMQGDQPQEIVTGAPRVAGALREVAA